MSSFETTLGATRPVAEVLGSDWVEIEPGIYVQSVDAPPPLSLVAEPEPSNSPLPEPGA